MNSTTNNSEIGDQIRFVDYYQTPLNAGTYEVTATLTAPDALKDADISTSTTVKLSVAGPRFFLPPAEIYSVFPPENGAGDYNNILPHIVLNRHTLPWERLVDEKVGTDTIKATQNNELDQIPFLALLVFSEDEENNGYDLNLMALNNATDLPSVGNGLVFVAKVGEFYHARIFDRTGAIVVGSGNSQFSPSPELAETLLMSFKGATIGTSIPVVDQTKRDIIRKITLSLGHPEANSDVIPPTTVSLADLVTDPNFKYALEPGEKLTDKVNVIDIKPELLRQIMPTGEELHLLAHGREHTPGIGIIPNSKATKRLIAQEIRKGSPAEKAGFKVNDTITRIGDDGVDDEIDNPIDRANKVLLKYRSGEKVIFYITRGNRSDIPIPITIEQPKQRAVIIANRLPAPPFLGVTPDANQPNQQSVLVKSVDRGSIAAKAGIQPSDIILKINGVNVHDLNGMNTAVNSHKVDDNVTFAILRPEQLKMTKEPGTSLGITTEGNSATQSGLLVKSVDPDSIAAKAGIQPSDIILKINDVVVHDVDGMQAAVDIITFAVLRPDKLKMSVGESGIPLGITTGENSATQSGVLVKSVAPDSIATKAGIQSSDIILKINDVVVHDVDGMKAAVGSITFAVLRPRSVDSKRKRRNTTHLVMLENRYRQDSGNNTWSFSLDEDSYKMVRLVCLKSWQFNCTADEPTLRGRLLSDAFTFEPLCVPKTSSSDNFEQIRLMSYTALPYHLRWGDRAHTLYHGPLVASAASNNYPNKDAVQEIAAATTTLETAKKALLDTKSNDEKSKKIAEVEEAEKALHQTVDRQVPASADGLVRILRNEHIFDVSLAAAWQLGQMLMLRDQSTAMEYFSWRRRDAQLRARKDTWAADGHLHLGDNAETGLTALPKNVQDWFQKHLELRGLPFEYLIPDARMLPENSLRIFCIHETWMECFLSGTLAVGRGGEADRVLEAEYRSIIYPQSARNRTGFLLRSPAVDEHLDLKVVANEGKNSEVRLERIGTGLLLGLYDGTLSKLEFSLPPIGLHFGFKESDNRFTKDIKDQNGGETNKSVAVQFKGDRIVNVEKLAEDIETAPSPSSFAFQMCEGTEKVEFRADLLSR